VSGGEELSGSKMQKVQKDPLVIRKNGDVEGKPEMKRRLLKRLPGFT
jgi:hypothetical protein